jgi:hypothetical protein
MRYIFLMFSFENFVLSNTSLYFSWNENLLFPKELGAKCVIGWNHKEFEVPYICLSDEIKIGKGGFQIKINFLVDKEMGQYVCRILGNNRFSFHEK